MGEFTACARALARGLLLIFLVITLVSTAVPHCDSYDSCKPKDRENEVDGCIRVDIGETPGSGPHGHHDLVDKGRYAEEALDSLLSLIHI